MQKQHQQPRQVRFLASGEPVKNRQQEINEAIEKTMRTVCATMGPAGGNVLISEFGRPFFTKDGYTVAQYLTHHNLLDRTIGQVILDAAKRTVDEAGDGTTTTTLLVHAIYQNLMLLLEEEDSNVNKFYLARAMNSILDLCENFLDDIATELINENGVIDYQMLKHVTTISANNDTYFGQMVADIINAVGIDGRVFLEQSKENETYTEHYNGYTFDTVCLSKAALKNKAQVTLKDPLFVIIDIKVDQLDMIEPILEDWLEEKYAKHLRVGNNIRPLVFIVTDMLGSALSNIVANIKRNLPLMVVKAPDFMEKRRDLLADICLYTNTHRKFSTVEGESLDTWGNDFDPETNEAFESMLREPWREFGGAKEVVVTKNKCTIIGGDGDNADSLSAHIQALKTRLHSEEEDKEDREFLKTRISRLTSGVGVVYVGGNSEVERKYNNHVLDDSIKAGFCALQTGIVPGGGRVYQLLSQKLNGLEAIEKEENIALNAIQLSLLEPFRKIAHNASNDDKVVDDYEALAAEISPSAKFEGIHPITGESVNLYQQGIVDPKGVSYAALKNAISVVKQLITTKELIIPEE